MVKYINDWDYVILFALIYTSRDTVMFGTNESPVMSIIGYIVPIIVLLILYVKYKIVDNYRTDQVVAVLLVCTIFTMIFNFEMIIKNGYELLLLLIASRYVRCIKFEKFTKVYCNILYVLSVISSITAVAFLLYPSFVNIFPTIINKSTLVFYNLWLCVIPQDLYGVSFRMYGIFREPGVAIIFINIALLFELFCFTKINIKHIAVLVISVIFTFSTAGYIVTFFIFLIYAIANNKVNRSQAFPLSLLILSVFSVLLYSSDFVYDLVLGKFSNSESSSTAARFGSITNNIRLLLDNPHGLVVGLGYQFVEDVFVHYGQLARGEGHNTNTILKLLSLHGIIYVSICLSKVMTFINKCLYQKGFCAILLFVSIMMLFSNEDLTVNILLYLIVFYSFNTNANAYESN